MRGALFLVVIAALVAAAPSIARAGRTPYGWLFGTEVIPERGAEIQTWIAEENGKPPDFPEPGVVHVYCNIHPEMAATILVLPNRRHTRAGPDGRFSLAGVPPGTWTVFAYTRRALKPASAKVTVTAGVEAVVDLAVVRGAETEHRNKYGAKYTGPGGTYP